MFNIMVSSPEQIPDVVKTIRGFARLTQGQLGEKVGVSATYIGRFESGQREVPLKLLFEIAKACKFTLEFRLERWVWDQKSNEIEKRGEQDDG